MTDLELERLLGSLPVRAPDADRERELLARLSESRAVATAWWTRRIPLWQAAAACVAVFAASVVWLREPSRQRPTPAEPVIVRIDQALFANAVSAGERIDVSRWGSLPAGRE
jgi:hypothetical protein